MNLRRLYETTPERNLRQALEGRDFTKGVHFAIQYPLRLSFILDFAFPKEKVAIEVDGHFWHSSKKAKKYDSFKDKVLKGRGWEVLRFSDFEIQENLDRCVGMVLATLKKRGGL